jgi:BirA family transcriptional regulator, biotin operon repressor / biotin---[acetyl-CoA-carboxylase] ligase
MKTISLGSPLIRLASVDSTNTYATQLMRKESVTEGTVILAEVQTQGRGQGGNSWLSDKGLNLLASIILKPDFLPAHQQFYLSMCISAGIQEYISKKDVPAVIKWPNDILIHHKKVAGILIENTILSQNLNTSVVGIGLNVNQEIFPAGLPDPTSLKLELHKSFDVPAVLGELLPFVEARLSQLYAGNFNEIKTLYLNKLWLMNTRARFTDRLGTYEGKIVDVAESGELVVVTTNGETRLYGFKEVVYQQSGR